MGQDVALIGFGEAAMTFASSGRWCDRAAVYDRKSEDSITARTKSEDYASAGVIARRSASAAAECAPLIISLVTADQALHAARAAAAGVASGAIYCDGNSVAPETKRAAAQLIEANGGYYVDMAILAPVIPARMEVPILLSGAAANVAASALGSLGFANIVVSGSEVGRASSIKMIRSVIVKGLEALTAECVLAASEAGVLDEVLASLDASERPKSWRDRADYNLDRMLVHGERRAAEMEEAAATLEDLGILPIMTRGTVRRQRELGELAQSEPATGLEGKIDAVKQVAGARGYKAA